MRQPDVATLEALIVQSMRTDNWSVVAELEARLDTALQATQTVSLASAALYYAEQHLKVFPLQPRSKLPHKGTRGFKDADYYAAVISDWWDLWPNSNIGIATGHRVDVIDIDGQTGAHSYANTEGLPQPLGIVRTPHGRHLYIPAAGRTNKARLFPGIDIRGTGGYVVAPPSISAEGVVYRWTRPLNLEGSAA